MKHESEIVASRFKTWLEADGLLDRLEQNSFAFFALPTDQQIIEAINRVARERIPEIPLHEFVVGEDGAGNYFTSASGNVEGEIKFFDHEWKRYVEAESYPTLRAYYEYCVGVGHS